ASLLTLTRYSPASLTCALEMVYVELVAPAMSVLLNCHWKVAMSAVITLNVPLLPVTNRRFWGCRRIVGGASGPDVTAKARMPLLPSSAKTLSPANNTRPMKLLLATWLTEKLYRASSTGFAGSE